ncbi:hypothetical protein BDZ97DRAFT_1854189 [Flammula alnicola]|nr:hypothetical protein BDZ97DRAFT_1854189 [Flammula alnicola]
MPWCISTSPFDLSLAPARRKRRLRRPLKISAPIPRPSGSMQFRSSSVDVNTDGNSHPDSGVFYLVPNKSGTGKTIVRRRAPPSTSPPVAIDINDNNTKRGTLGKGTATASGGQKRPMLAVRTTSPVVDQNDGSTARTTTPRPRFDPMRAFRNSFLGKQGGNEGPSGSGHRWKGKGREEPPREDEAVEMRESRVSAKAREIREWMKGKSGSDIHRSASYADSKPGNGGTKLPAKNRQTVGGVRDLFKNRRTAPAPRDRGPKAGQTYEIVDHRIIENNPERTVEISTWREEATKKPKPEEEEDTMSIYYISADEYAQEGEHEHANETIAKVEWRVDASEVPPEGMDYAQTGSTSRQKSAGDGVSNPSTSKNTQERTKSNSWRQRSETGKGVTSPLQRERTISPSTSEKEPSSSPNDTPTGGHQVAETPTAGSSAPERKPSQRVPRQRGRYKESTPIDNQPSQSLFHPTQSGSTISSIKSESTVQFEAILHSCEPSLLHIAPILRSLGIRRMEHLRAVARLTPTTRDREIKEDALRLGITVMEWAILVDKIFTL